MATETKRRSRSDPATEAWDLITEIFATNRGRFVAVLGEFDLWPPQWFALQALDEPTPMGKLAGMLHCDSSNVTGIIDRLEQRGLVERRPAEHDRRVKLLVLTAEGRSVREQIQRRLSVPPEAISSLSRTDQRALRDLLRRAVAS
jgi:DNA-binding MarR family transcriptional regulator